MNEKIKSQECKCGNEREREREHVERREAREEEGV